MSDKDADSFFLDMLQAIGVRLLRRRLMWTAVTFGTRWRNPGWRRWLIVLWAIAGIAGIGAFFFGVTALAFGVLGPFQWLALAGIVPLPASALWGRQWRAGVLAAISAVWLIPPTLVGGAGFTVYLGLEYVVSKVVSKLFSTQRAGTEPRGYEQF